MSIKDIYRRLQFYGVTGVCPGKTPGQRFVAQLAIGSTYDEAKSQGDQLGMRRARQVAACWRC